MNQTIDKMVEEKFLTIFSSAKKSATNKFQEEVIKNSNKLTVLDKIQLLNHLQETLSKRKNSLEIPAYVNAGQNEEILIKIFSSRTTILNVDDTNLLTESIYLSVLSSLLNHEHLTLKDQLTEYSLEDF